MARPKHEMDEQTKRLKQLDTLEKLGAEYKVSFGQALAQQTALKPQVTVDHLKQFILSLKPEHNAAAKNFLAFWYELIKAKMAPSGALLPSARQLSTERLPKGNPVDAEHLEGQMDYLGKVASACGVSYEPAVKNTTKDQLRSYVHSNDERERRAASIALDEWRGAIEKKQASVQQAQGATPKITTPPSLQKPKLVSHSESEILGLAQDQRDYILGRHNAWRGRCGSLALEYDLTLEAHAQQWANDLAGRQYWGPSPHNNNRMLPAFSGEVGENISRGKGSGATGASVVDQLQSSVDGWALEFKQHDFTTHRSAGTGHFTQVVWRATTKMGCGFAHITLPGGGWYWVCVCNYHPAGNIMFSGPDPYQLYTKNVSKPQ